jgi:hypothetical protein
MGKPVHISVNMVQNCFLVMATPSQIKPGWTCLWKEHNWHTTHRFLRRCCPVTIKYSLVLSNSCTRHQSSVPTVTATFLCEMMRGLCGGGGLRYKVSELAACNQYIIAEGYRTSAVGKISWSVYFFCNSILFAICTNTFSKLCKNMYKCIRRHVEECSVALLCK